MEISTSINNRIVNVRAKIAKDYEERITFFTPEAKKALEEWMAVCPQDKLFFNLRAAFEKIDTSIRMKHMRKFFSQQTVRLVIPQVEELIEEKRGGKAQADRARCGERRRHNT